MLPQTIQFKRHTGAALIPPTLAEGEPAYNDTATIHNLYIGGTGGGAAVRTLISPTRQVEIAGAQTITGTKTIGVANLRIPDAGADPGDFLTLVDETTGELDWATLPAGGLLTVAVNPPITGTGVNAGTALSITVASAGDITGGTNNVNMVTAAGLRSLTGDVATLTSTIGAGATNLTAAMGLLHGQITALSAAMVWVGEFNGTVLTAVPPATTGPLPAPAAGNRGWTVIVTAAIPTGTAPVPPGPIAIGDWLVSPGTGTTWTHIPLFHAVESAANIAFTPIVGPPAITSTNVAGAITELNTRSGTALTYYDSVSIGGLLSNTGAGLTAANALTILVVDGGTYS